MDIEKIGKFIKQLRTENNLTQKELAEKLHITDRAVSKWERGKGCPDISYLEDLSKIFNVSILELLKGTRSEIVTSNQEVMTSIDYASKITKEKIFVFFNEVITFIIVSVIIIVVLFNIRNFYYANTYEDNFTNYIVNKQDINALLIKIKIIRENQGIYTNDEYQEILTSLTEIEDFLQLQLKETYRELYTYKGYNMGLPDTNKIYKILLTHDIEKYSSLERKYNIENTINSEYVRFYENARKNIYGYRLDGTNYVHDYMLAKDVVINVLQLLIDDIMEVGEINEE